MSSIIPDPYSLDVAHRIIDDQVFIWVLRNQLLRINHKSIPKYQFICVLLSDKQYEDLVYILNNKWNELEL